MSLPARAVMMISAFLSMASNRAVSSTRRRSAKVEDFKTLQNLPLTKQILIHNGFVMTFIPLKLEKLCNIVRQASPHEQGAK